MPQLSLDKSLTLYPIELGGRLKWVIIKFLSTGRTSMYDQRYFECNAEHGLTPRSAILLWLSLVNDDILDTKA